MKIEISNKNGKKDAEGGEASGFSVKREVEVGGRGGSTKLLRQSLRIISLMRRVKFVA